MCANGTLRMAMNLICFAKFSNMIKNTGYNFLFVIIIFFCENRCMLDRGSKKNVFSYFVILSNSSKDGQLSNVFGSLLREVSR